MDTFATQFGSLREIILFEKYIHKLPLVLVSAVVKTGDSVLCWPEGLGFDTRAGRSMRCGVRGLSLTTHYNTHLIERSIH